MATSVGAVALDLSVNKATTSALTSSLKKVGSVIAGVFAVSQITSFTKACVESASEVQSAFTGLNSIVQGTGNSFKAAQDFINEYTADGLVSIEETATAYKNLLSRGYDTSQIEDVLTRLKDSAAFGRQASYDLGEAVVSATEGLKNENSILVDNAGVTKNVAKMWEEWADAHNTTTSAMTTAQKIEAEYNGIMEETKFQVGDAAAYTQTFSGQVQQLKFNFNQMKTAIGQVVTPLAQLFIPVINSAITAVTNLFNTIGDVLEVFGFSMPTVVSKTSDSVSDLSSSISDTADTAVSSAKKITKAFAGVDEINVLKTSESSSSSDSSTGTSVSVTPTVASDSAVSAAISATVDKIKKFIEPLQNISFDNLINAFSNLWDALTPFGQTIGSGLEWLYFNVLVPLAQWTIEDVLPSFLDLLSGAFSVLNPLLETFGSIFEPVWNNLLQPVLSWTGGTIVDIINGVADALTRVGDWMSNNQGTLETCVTTFGIFFGLWKLTEIAAFIQMAGGVTSALALMTSAIYSNIAAKLIDKAETIAIIALYAKDFVTSLASSTAALVSNAAQWVASTTVKIADTAATIAGTVATTAATAATWLFNAALAVLTSPITLVIAAIAALIAIVYLLITNWDTVKEVAAKCWDKIKEVWNVVADWFNSTVVEPLKEFFTGMWDGLKNGASNAWEGIKCVFSTVGTFFKDTFSKAWTAVKNIFSTGGKIFDGIKDGIVSAFKTVVNGIIKGINKVVSVPFNAINTALKKIKSISIAGIKPFSWLSTISVPQIPMLAQGGYVPANNPQLAIVGDNKQHGEIIAPDDKIYNLVDKAIKDNNTTTSQHLDMTIYVKYEDGRTIIKKVNQAEIEAGEILLLA